MTIGKRIKRILMIGAVAAQLLAAAPAPRTISEYVHCGFSWGYWYVCLPIMIGGTGESE